MLPLRLHERAVKSVRKARVVDSWFVGKFAFSPYQACAHGCTYCDGRTERYWVGGEFDRDIVVRRNAPEVLAREASKLRERGAVFVGSGISDAYQPPEATERLMPAYSAQVQRRAEAAFARVGLPRVMPHRLYHGRLPLYDEVDVLLQQLPRHYAHHPDALRRLEAPRRRYREWLLSRKGVLARHRKLGEANLTEELVALAGSADWPDRLGSDKLAAFLREIIVDRRVFDEATLTLR